MKTKEEKRLMEQKMREAEQLAVKLVEQSERRSWIVLSNLTRSLSLITLFLNDGGTSAGVCTKQVCSFTSGEYHLRAGASMWHHNDSFITVSLTHFNFYKNYSSYNMDFSQVNDDIILIYHAAQLKMLPSPHNPSVEWKAINY